MLTSGNPIRRQDPPVTMTIALPHRLHRVFVEGPKKASMPLGMYVVQMIEAAWAERCGVAEAAPPPPIADEGITVTPVPPKVLKPAAPAKEITRSARKLAPAEMRLIRGLLAAGMTPREITKEHAYTAAQIAAARGQS